MPNNMQAVNPFPSPISLRGYQNISGACSDSTDLVVSTGNLTKTVRLVSVPTVGVPLEFDLFYNSQETITASPLGPNWRHTYMQTLAFNGPPVTQVTYFAEGGMQYVYVLQGSTWTIQATSGFMTGQLTQSGSNWLITFPETNTVYTFNSTGQLMSIADGYGNTTTLTYSSGLLSTITEATGRQVALGYTTYGTTTLITSVTDPRGNVFTLGYDATHTALTSVTSPAPEGCTVTYGYPTPSNGQMTTYTDGNGKTWTYGYNASNQLTSVTSPDTSQNSITYVYDTTTETAGDNSSTLTFNRTTLTDARGNKWVYIFDYSNNLWRIVDPNSYNTHFYWDENQDLLYTTGNFAPSGNNSNRDNLNNRFERRAYDYQGNLLAAIDPVGKVTQYTYDSNNHLLSVFPGRAHAGIQGDWTPFFGSLGYVLCGADPSGNGHDVVSLPSYLSLSYPSAVLTFLADTQPSIFDPRTPLGKTGPTRELGFWRSTSAFSVTLTSTQTTQYNLSVYVSSTDVSGFYGQAYDEQTGRDVLLSVSDATGVTQTFEVYNDASGFWVTFPVKTDSSHPVVLTVQPKNACPSCQIVALALDAYDNHQTTFTYNSQGDILTVTDPLGNQSAWTYNANGTLATFKDARNHTTTFYQDDTSLNITRVVDANSQTWHLTYDLNGNLLTLEDPNLHTWQFAYDAKNRLHTATDPLTHTTTWDYDAAGNVTTVTDANSKQTQFFYTATNRLSKVVDAAGGSTQFGFDGAGNLTSFETPLDSANSRSSTFTWDASERMTLATLADGTTQIGAAYDTLHQLRAVTSPNGMQSALSQINLSGAQNWLWNGGAESADYYTPSMPQLWSGVNATASRDTTYAHSGTASFKMSFSIYDAPEWFQDPVFVRGGERLIFSGYAASNDTTGTLRMQFGFVPWTFAGTMPSEISTNLAAPTQSQGWQPIPRIAYTVPADGQYTHFPLQEIRLRWGNTGANAWFDDLALNSVSSSLSYDAGGSPNKLTTPEGAQRSWTYDRFGRLTQLLDPNGNTVSIAYDGKDQVTTITDSLGNTTTFSFDGVGNLIQVTDAKSNVTSYAYDPTNRLQTITYPDTTTESFVYDNAGNLHTYTNNRSQVRTFAYDNANRLLSVTYSTDSTSVGYTYDNMDHVLTRTERNGDVTTFTYDNLYRVTNTQRTPGTSSPVLGWTNTAGFDVDSNQTSFSSTVSGQVVHSWSVPGGDYDALDRLTQWNDRQNGAVKYQYDVDSNRTGITYPYGTSSPQTSATYDVVDRLLALSTDNNGPTVLPVSTTYDLASQRLSGQVGGDHADYVYDANGQLIQENINRFVERDFNGFKRGILVGTQTDGTSNNVSLAALSDSLTSGQLNMDRWRLAVAKGSYSGLFILPQNGNLTFLFPFWGTDLVKYAAPPVYDTFMGLNTLVYGAVEHRVQLVGDFDVQVNFLNYQGLPHNSSINSAILALTVADTHFEQAIVSPGNKASIARDCYSSYHGTIYSAGTSVANVRSSTTSDQSGIFRIQRSVNTLTLYYWDNVNLTWITSTSYSSFTTAPLYVSLSMQFPATTGDISGTGAFQNFQVNAPTPNWATSGTYTSLVYDAGTTVNWTNLSFTADVSGGGSVQLLLKYSTDGTSWSTAGPYSANQTLSSIAARYMQYQATLTPGTVAHPTTLSRVDLAYQGANASSATLFSYDSVGNLTSKTTDTSAGTSTAVRSNGTGWPSTDNINNLNQIVRQDVTLPGGSATTWRYTWDASGNLLTKSNGIVQYTFTWDEDNRLTQWQGSVLTPAVYDPGSGQHGTYDDLNSVYGPAGVFATVTYTYDSLGRMTTRTDAAGTTKFVWAGMDCVQEVGPDGTVTRYYVVAGEMLMFERQVAGGASVTYQCLTDYLGSVRMVLDSANNVVAQYYTDAWGGVLPASYDNVPGGGLAYQWVGSYGVRYDQGTGLYYMRQRWYDPTLGRFSSRDLVPNPNRYLYANNVPAGLVDPSGLDPWGPAATPRKLTTALQIVNKRNTTDCKQFSWWEGLKESAAATGSGIPFIGPKIFRGHYNPDDPLNQISQLGGGVGFTLLGVAGGLGAIQTLNRILLPPVVYHFTSVSAAVSIYWSGTLQPGVNNLYGVGVYVTATNNATMAAIQGAASTEIAIPIETQGLEVIPTYFPGTYYLPGATTVPYPWSQP